MDQIQNVMFAVEKENIYQNERDWGGEVKTNEEIESEIIDQLNDICDEVTVLNMRVLDLREKLKRLDLQGETKQAIAPKIVKTSTGHEWEIGEFTAKDLTSGLIWNLKGEDGTYTHQEALDKFGDKLPTKEEFEIAEEHGCRDVLNLSSTWYWSASVYSNFHATAWIFDGAYGFVHGSVFRSFNYAVRCVGR